MRYPKTIVAATIVVTGASLWAAPQVGFDYNLLNLQADGTESVVWERKAAAAAGRSVFAALSSAPSLADARGQAGRVPAPVLGVATSRACCRCCPISRPRSSPFCDAWPPWRTASARDLRAPWICTRSPRSLATLQRRMDLAKAKAGPGRALRGGPRDLARDGRASPDGSKGRERGAVEVALGDYQARLAEDFAQQWQRLQRATRPTPITLGDLPEELRRKFIGKSGQLLLQVYSRLDLWDRASQERFVEELRTVDPDVTGQPVVGYESTRLIERTFRMGLAYAFVLVAGIAALMIRRVRETVLAMVPLILGTLWTRRAHAARRDQVQSGERLGACRSSSAPPPSTA